ncbi:unnamed protein product, partial [marine sediment metagenome]
NFEKPGAEFILRLIGMKRRICLYKYFLGKI